MTVVDDDPATAHGSLAGISGSTDALAAAIMTGSTAGISAHAETVLGEQLMMLKEQRRVLRLQAEELEREGRINHRSLRLRHFNELMKAGFGLAVAAIGAVALLGLAALIWRAHEAHGLVVEPLRTPADLAGEGLDGTVLAQQVIDRLNDYTTQSDILSFRAADTIAGNWGDESKVEIPETGISIGELSSALHRWLGHETRLSGEVFRHGDRLTVRLRVDGNAPVNVSGPERDLDALIGRASEAVFAQTQPFRYQMYLGQAGRTEQAIALSSQMASSGPGSERAWAYASWGNWLMTLGKYREAVERANESLALDASNPQALSDLFLAHWALGHLEQALAADEALVRSLQGGRPDVAPLMSSQAVLSFRQGKEELIGAWNDSIAHDEVMTHYTIYQFNLTIPPLIVMDYAQIYDATGARAHLRALPQWNDRRTTSMFAIMGPELPEFFTLAAENDWRAAANDLAGVDHYALTLGTVDDVRHTLIWPWLAYAEARSGHFPEARALAFMTPLDCNLCLRIRGRIEALSGHPVQAAGWYARADVDAPSYPFALTDWGAMLLDRGDPDGAIAKFRTANKRVPRFADPLELWGEALIQKNRSDLALAKFEEANKCAPRWGRLHLKWGEALFYGGRRDEAKAQFSTAANLDLSDADRQALVLWRVRT